MNRTIATCLFSALLAGSAISSAQTPRISIDTAPLPPPVSLDIGKRGQPIELQSLDVRSEIAGGLARTRVEMRFFNPNDRVLEGELRFPLLAGQEIDGFALDIDGELRDAVPVEKARGKQVFEEVIRRRVDPALLETTAGENFRLRVYPLPARGTRRVVVHYSEPLASAQGRYHYRFALAQAEPLASFTLEVRVASPAGTPSGLAIDGRPIELAQSGSWYRGTIQRKDFAARGWLEISLPDGSAKAAAIAAVAQGWGGETYVQLDAPIAWRRAARALPSRIAIFWDSSMSGRLRDHAAEFALLDAYFKAMRNGTVDLVRLRDVAEPAASFTIRGGDWTALRRALQDTVYDGASNLHDWPLANGIDEVLFFSDGLDNFGADIARERPANPDLRIYPVVASASANRAWMRHLVLNRSATRSGALIDLAGGRQAAIDTLLQAQTEVTASVDSGDGELLIDRRIVGNGRLRISGRFRGSLPAAIEVQLRDPDGRQRRIRVPIRDEGSAAGAGNEAPLLARQWARLEIDRLDGDNPANREQIRRLGLKFGLLTAETSLIVLDDVADYVRHGIEPPASLRSRYDMLKADHAHDEDVRLKAHLQQIAQQYAEKIAWWKRDFPKTPEVHVLAKELARAERAVGSTRQAPASREQPAAPPPAPMAEPAPMLAGGVADSAIASAAESKQDADARNNDAGNQFAAPPISIGLKKWTPDAPYLARLRAASDSDLYVTYLDARADWLNSSAFYLDAADLLFERKQDALGLRVLSNLAEMDLENRAILRILGYRLLQAGKPQFAVPLFEQVRELAPFEPQSFRDLGLAYADFGALQDAADALYEVAKREWDGRFAEVGLIALTEMNALIATHPGAIDTSRFDKRLLRNLPVDLRVVLNWDADNSDMDLWVTDPNGERAYYGNRLTRQGGRMSADLTSGYGPEEFMLKAALPGRYKVEANYYGNRQQLISGTVTLRLALITAFGTPRAREQSTILRLEDRQETVLVGEFEVGAAGASQP
ncbi:VIT domain-containing protein [Dokdonella immobilis]|uniref:Tetratricopeptide repeat-containing protein n=1 Tax=Dokdonella immobilis TaxID=578942 RepID=A0A1I4Z409_9GAMM|nr:VIT domain-containing protein [Dokdonella immobilis]SFN45001.1 Tetratricopeptide repeat-containing protein [Dokdonella immobilis]